MSSTPVSSLFTIPNLSAKSVTRIAPWEFKHPDPLPEFTGKAQWREWCMDPNTRSCFYSGFEGQDPDRRVDETNQPLYVHAIVVDYDAPVTPEMLTRLIEHPASTNPPAWFCQTKSGNGRLVWLLEARALVGSTELAEHFLRVAAKELKVKAYLPAFDEAFFKPAQYYAVGEQWHRVSGTVVPSNTVHRWLLAAGRNLRTIKTEYHIPIPRIAEEVERRFPGRWKGEFLEGRLGVRFWDPAADCPTGCVVRHWGMQCFTGPVAFMTWADVFGQDFVKNYEADRLGPIRDNTFYDGRTFWMYNPQATAWRDISKDDFGQLLKCAGFSGRLVRGETSSEIDRIEADIKQSRYVERALPFVHHPTGLLIYQGTRVLNIATAKCLPPAPDGSVLDWEDGAKNKFPWIASFLTSFFDPPEQLNYFFAWLKHFYANGLAQVPRPGQALVIAGPPGRGKTFLSTGLIAGMVGGSVNAKGFLVDQQQWTEAVTTKPLMCVDDALAASDHQTHLRFTSLLKKMVADRTITYNEKFKKVGEVDWIGRVVVTCNTDPESLRMLPNLEMSVLDKLSFFMAGDYSTLVLPGYSEMQAHLKRELPFFCRWLLDWPIPENLRAKDPRFGVIPYHHPDLAQASIQQGPSHAFAELLSTFLRSYQEAHPGKKCWSGSAMELYADLQRLNEFVTRQWRYNQVPIMLGQLKSRGYNLQTIKNRSAGTNRWVIPFDFEDTSADPKALRSLVMEETEKLEREIAAQRTRLGKEE